MGTSRAISSPADFCDRDPVVRPEVVDLRGDPGSGFVHGAQVALDPFALRPVEGRRAGHVSGCELGVPRDRPQRLPRGVQGGSEALALAECCRGWNPGEGDARALVVRVQDAVELEGLGERPGLELRGFLGKVRALTPCQALAVVDAAERYWLLPERAGVEPPAALREVGLLR